MGAANATKSKAAPRERFFAYRCTGATGTLAAKIEPGQHILEREYKGNGTFTWTVMDFDKPKAPVVGTMTGRYVGQVEGVNGQLTAASKRMLRAAG